MRADQLSPSTTEQAQAIELDRLDELMRGTPVVAVGSLIASVFVGLAFIDGPMSSWVTGWLAASCLIALGRCAFSGVYFAHIRAGGGEVQPVFRVWAATSLINGALWGVLSLIQIRPGGLPAETLLHVALCAVGMGSTLHLSGHFWLQRAHTVLALVPLIVRDVWAGGALHLQLAAMCAVVVVYTLLLNANHAKAMVELILQRRRNAELIEALRVENQAKDEARRLAEEASAARTRLFAAANHDLRQPLQAVSLLSQNLAQARQMEQVHETAERIQSCVESLGDLVDGMLELAQLDASVIRPREETFAMAGLLREALDAHRPLAAAKGLRLQGPETDLWVRSDRRLVLRVLNNLLSNAIRYTQQGDVTVRLKQEGARLMVAVADTGIGIATDQRKRIFDDFYQVGNPARDRRHGLGLGLANARRIGELLGLDLALESELGRYSVFSFWLPVTPPPSVPGASSAAVELPADLLHKKILVVEDDETSRMAMVDLLASWGCDIQATASSRQALQVVEDGFSPELVIADLRLGDGLDGLGLIEHLRLRSAQPLPAVLITGDAVSNEVRQTQRGPLTLLRKPVKPAQLRALVQQVFASTEGPSDP